MFNIIEEGITMIRKKHGGMRHYSKYSSNNNYSIINSYSNIYEKKVKKYWGRH